ncbi:hypothetical protein TNCV_1144381 [Trichonephila clavipes]|nr:hypothetical protein TNCV_1144381 [Trichonephila clavipes]
MSAIGVSPRNSEPRSSDEDYIQADTHSPNYQNMPTGGLSLNRSFHAEIVEVEIEVVSPSIVPSGNFAELNRTVTCMVLKANDRRTSCPCHDEFRGPRSDYVRQEALENRIQLDYDIGALLILFSEGALGG